MNKQLSSWTFLQYFLNWHKWLIHYFKRTSLHCSKKKRKRKEHPCRKQWRSKWKRKVGPCLKAMATAHAIETAQRTQKI